METNLLLFLNKLNDLRNFINGILLQERLLAFDQRQIAESEYRTLLSTLQQHVSKTKAEKRRFDYNTSIVSLYGSFEQYVESLIQIYITNINTIIPHYNELPDPIIKNNIELSYALMKRAEHSLYRGSVTVPQIVANLHSCMNAPDNYNLTPDVFSHHTANFKADVIEDSLCRIGINNTQSQFAKSSIFANYLKEAFPDRDISTIREQEYLYILNDLALRRNDVAHGIISDILSNQILLDYVKFFEAYGRTLHELILSRTLQFSVHYNGKPLGTPTDVYKDGTVICIFLENIALKVGDWLVACNPNNPNCIYLGGEIEEIQIDGAPVPEIVPHERTEYGIKIPFRVKRNYNVYLI